MKRPAPGFVSVVISVRNGSPWITDQLRAITSQETSVPFEIVIADGGSNDDTVERVRAFMATGVPVHLVDASCRRGKQYGQRLGVQAARGDLLAFADADDVAAPGWLQGLVDASVAYEMVGGRLDLGSLNSPAVLASRPWVARKAFALPEAVNSGLVHAEGANCAIWKSVYVDIDDPNADLPPEAAAVEDMDLMFRLRRSGGTVGFARDAVMAYRLRADGPALRRQMRQYGVGVAILVKRYGDLGAHGDPWPRALRKWGFLVPRAIKAYLEGDELHWARSDLAYALGQVEGSVRFRVLCL